VDRACPCHRTYHEGQPVGNLPDMALTFAVLLSLPIGLFPNPYMPPMVRQAHFYGLASPMLVFGGIAGWVLHIN